MVEKDIGAEDLLASISDVINREASTLAEMPKGLLTSSSEQLIHGAVGKMARIAQSIKADAKSPNPDSIRTARALARTQLTFLANHLANHLVDLSDTITSGAGIPPMDDTDFIIAAVKMVRRPDDFPELVEGVKNVSPIGDLCIDAAKVMHKVVAYAEQRIQKTGGDQRIAR